MSCFRLAYRNFHYAALILTRQFLGRLYILMNRDLYVLKSFLLGCSLRPAARQAGA